MEHKHCKKEHGAMENYEKEQGQDGKLKRSRENRSNGTNDDKLKEAGNMGRNTERCKEHRPD